MELELAYTFGRDLQVIRRLASSAYVVKGDDGIRDYLSSLSWYLFDFKLAWKTQEEIDEIIDKLEKSYKKGETINEKDAKELIDKIKIWDDRIKTELSEREMIEVFTEGTLNF